MRRALLTVIDAFEGARDSTPHARFQRRFTVGASLLGLVVAVPSLIAAVTVGDALSAALIAAFIALVALQLGAVRLGAPVAVVMWSLLGTVGVFLAASSLTTRELQPQQLPWLVLIPLTALVLVGPHPEDDAPGPSARAPTVAAGIAIALGLLVVAAHSAGLTFDRPVAPSPAWLPAVDFVVFMFATGGLLYLHRLSARETELELRQLRQLVSVCAWCKRIRHDEEWLSVERYLATRARWDLTHGMCPECYAAHFPQEAPPGARPRTR